MLSKEELQAIAERADYRPRDYKCFVECKAAGDIPSLLSHIRELEAENAALRASDAHKGRALIEAGSKLAKIYYPHGVVSMSADDLAQHEVQICIDATKEPTS